MVTWVLLITLTMAGTVSNLVPYDYPTQAICEEAGDLSVANLAYDIPSGYYVPTIAYTCFPKMDHTLVPPPEPEPVDPGDFPSDGQPAS